MPKQMGNFIQIPLDVIKHIVISSQCLRNNIFDGNKEGFTLNHTLSYYKQNAEAFVENTVHADFHEASDRFLCLMQREASILDFGCGSGRDTKYFLEQGYLVDAIDGSEELCRYASAYTGIPVKCMLFQELEKYEKYDGIWACASILHVSRTELPDVFRKMIRSLKQDGIIYTSFKYGDFEGERNGRYFSDFTEESFSEFLVQFSELHMIEQWVSLDVRPERGDEKWLNLILRKSTIS